MIFRNCKLHSGDVQCRLVFFLFSFFPQSQLTPSWLHGSIVKNKPELYLLSRCCLESRFFYVELRNCVQLTCPHPQKTKDNSTPYRY